MSSNSLRATTLSALVATAGFGGSLSVPAQTMEPATEPAHAPHTDGSAFITESSAAMLRMMEDMHVTPTGDADVDFATMMIAHHQGAIDMAVAELRHGRNETLRRIAQEIIIEQQQEIAAMRLALAQARPSAAPLPD